MNDHLCVSKVSWKLRILTIYNFPVFYPRNLLPTSFSEVSIVFYVYKQNLTKMNSNLKTRAAINAKISVFFIWVEAIIYFLSIFVHGRVFELLKRHTFMASARRFGGWFKILVQHVHGCRGWSHVFERQQYFLSFLYGFK